MKRLAFALLVSMSFTGCGIELGYPLRGGGGGSTQDPNAPNYRIFVSNTGVAGNTNVLSADNICLSDGNRPTSGGSYRAMLVDGSTRTAIPNVGWVLTAGRQYIRPDGTYIGKADSTGVLQASLNNAISATSQSVWTGLGSGWSASPSNCSTWTSNLTTIVGAIGSAGTNNQYYSNGTSNCAASLHVYCVEQ